MWRASAKWRAWRLAPEGESEEVHAAGRFDGLMTGVHAQLPVEAPSMGLDRVQGQVELAGDLAWREGRREEAQHRELAARERLERPGATRTDGNALQTLSHRRRLLLTGDVRHEGDEVLGVGEEPGGILA